MSKHDKLLKRLLSRPRNFTYKELRTLLYGMGYKEENKGKASGSRVAYVHKKTRHIIRLHKPHPEKELRLYQIDQIIKILKNQEEIKL
ncbi:MAG: type II toxin-antitoxin system HicA family toxin [Dethiobacteria bacterium]|jgi:hypothetical protein